MKFQVYRTNSSSYQDGTFFQKEKAALESIPGVSYIKSLTEIQDDAKFILISNTHTSPSELPKAMLEKTALLIHPNSGYDNIPKSFAASATFPIIVGNPIRSNAVAEYVLSAIFHHFTPMQNHPYWSTDRKWNRKLLRDQNVLILGMGMIGTLLFQSLRPICSKVEVFDPYADDAFGHSNLRREMDSDLIKDKNIVVVAASLTSTSRGMVDQGFLKKLPKEVLLINAARGEIVNEEDLVAWAQKDERAKAYLDVFAEEPFRPGFLSEIKSVNKTSHIAGVHGSLNEDIIDFEKNIISDFVEHHNRSDIEGFKAKHRALALSENSINYK